MNEKFFDLKRDKQDRIIGAAMKHFAISGYVHASTDDMVKDAHISKGLLFHYFISKKNLYEFLYDYSVRFIKMEFAAVVGTDEMNFFELKKKVIEAWIIAMKQYPYIRLFLLKVDSEQNKDAVFAIDKIREEFRQDMIDLMNFHTKWEFSSQRDFETIKRMLECTEKELLINAPLEDPKYLTKYSESLYDSLNFLRGIFEIKRTNPEMF